MVRCVAGNTSNKYLTTVFERELRLTHIFISGGPSSDTNVVLKERRPRNVGIIAFGKDGRRTIKTITLKDVAARQNFSSAQTGFPV
jgi:hypothetical protein